MKLPGPLTDGQQKQLLTVQMSARHLLSLINDLLDLAKIESGKVQLQLEPVPIDGVLEEVGTALRPSAEAKGLEFSTVVSDPDIVVPVDRRALTQILLNLVSNAIKFTERGSIRIEVCQRQQNGSLTAEFSVVDTGMGIRPQDQVKLFQAFSRADSASTRRAEGTGLGLYLSQKVAELLGGRISLESEYGKGSRVTLALVTKWKVTIHGGPHFGH